MSLELASTLTLFQNAPLSFSVKPDVLRHFKINQLQSRYWFRPRHTNTSRYPSVWAFCLECAMSRSGKIRPLVWRMGTAWTLDNRLFMMLFVNRVLILALHFISSLSIPHTKSHIASPDRYCTWILSPQTWIVSGALRFKTNKKLFLHWRMNL